MRYLKLHTRTGIVDDEVIDAVAMVDDEDYRYLRQYTWYYKVDNAGDEDKKHISVGRNPVRDSSTHRSKSLVLLNRQIMCVDDPKIRVMFRDRNPLNCQKDNLYVTLDGHGLRRLQLHWTNDFTLEDTQMLLFPR